MYDNNRVLSLEDDSIVAIDSVLPVQLETNPFGDTVTGLLDASTVEDIMEADHELQEIGDADNLIDVTRTLSHLQDNLAQRTSANPLSRPAAEALQIALSAMTDRKIFTMEHFEGRQSRVIGTKLALEDVGENIRIFIQKIVRWIKRAVEVVFDHIEGMVRGANTTARQAEALQDLAGQIKAQFGDDEKVDGQIRNKKLRTLFTSKGGDTYAADEIKQHYEDMVKNFNETLSGKTAISGAQYLTNQIHVVLNKNRTGSFTDHAAEYFADATIRHMLGENFPQFTKGKDVLTRHYQPPFGGTEFVLSLSEKDNKLVAMSLIRRDVGDNKQETLPVLRPSEVLMLAKAVEASMHRGLYREYKKVKSTLYSLKTAISDMCDDISREQRTTYSGTIPSIHFLKTTADTVMRMVNFGYSYNGLVARAVLEYGRLSLKQYGTTE